MGYCPNRLIRMPDPSIASLCRQIDGFLKEPGLTPDHPSVQPVLSQLAALIGKRGSGTVAMAQINPVAGDLAGNAQKIMRYGAYAEAIGADCAVFPELSLMGYPIRDVIARHPFLAEENLKWLHAIAARSGQTHLIVGFVEPRHPLPGEKRAGKPFFNSLAVLGEGEIKALVRKSLLPTYDEFEDGRTFEAAPGSGVHHPETLCSTDWGFKARTPSGDLYRIGQQTYGISICEDTWNDSDFFQNGVMYRKDPVAELAAQKPDVLLNISASPTRSRKEQLKHNMLSHISKKYGIPYVYVNQTGSVDEVAFDGGSRVYDAEGNLIARARCFGEQFMVANPVSQQGWIEPLPDGLEKTLSAQKFFDAYDDTDLGRTYEALCQGIKDYFAKTGFQRAVLGVSGGLDSAVTAVLLADALGAQNVIAVSMPSAITPDDNKEDARALCKNLGVLLVETPIDDAVNALQKATQQTEAALSGQFGTRIKNSNAADNAQAIARSTILRQIGNDYNALPVATSDKSELYLGYATVNGDMSGALAPLGDVPKTKVRALFRWMNHHRAAQNALPVRILKKPSGADLKIDPKTGRTMTAEDDLMPYEFADEIIWRIEALRQSYHQMLVEDFQYEKTHAVSENRKKEWLDKFYSRMARAVFKWFIVPPVLMIEGNGSIAKTDYHHPITAVRIQWQGHTDAEIGRLLDEAAGTLPDSTRNG